MSEDWKVASAWQGHRHTYGLLVSTAERARMVQLERDLVGSPYWMDVDPNSIVDAMYHLGMLMIEMQSREREKAANIAETMAEVKNQGETGGG